MPKLRFALMALAAGTAAAAKLAAMLKERAREARYRERLAKLDRARGDAWRRDSSTPDHR